MSTNDPMTEHITAVTDGGTRVTCTCGWYSRWHIADGSAYEEAAAHKRSYTEGEA